MTLRDEENLILAYLEDDLPAEERRRFLERLEKDSKLARLVEQIRQDRQSLRELPAEPSPGQIMEEISRHLERSMLLEPTEERMQAVPSRRYRLGRWVAYGGLAAMVAIGAGLIIRTLLLTLWLKPAGLAWPAREQGLTETVAENRRAAPLAALSRDQAEKLSEADGRKGVAEERLAGASQAAGPAVPAEGLAEAELAKGKIPQEAEGAGGRARAEREVAEGVGAVTAGKEEVTGKQAAELEKASGIARGKGSGEKEEGIREPGKGVAEMAMAESRPEKAEAGRAKPAQGTVVRAVGATEPVAAGADERAGELIRVLLWTDQPEETVQQLEGWVARRRGAVLSEGMETTTGNGQREISRRRVVLVLGENMVGPLMVELNRPANQVADVVPVGREEGLGGPQEMLRRVQEAGVRQWGVEDWQRVLLRHGSVAEVSGAAVEKAQGEQAEQRERPRELRAEMSEQTVERYRLVWVEILPVKGGPVSEEDKR